MLSRSRRASHAHRRSAIPECVESSLEVGAEWEKAVDPTGREVFGIRNIFAVVNNDVLQFWQTSLHFPHRSEKTSAPHAGVFDI